MNIRMAAVAACALTLGSSPASASIITVMYTGTSLGVFVLSLPTSPNFVHFSDVSTTETYVFDTNVGTVTFDGNGGFTLTAALSARIDLYDVPGISPHAAYSVIPTNTLVVKGETVDVISTGSGVGSSMFVIGGGGPFQVGACPSFFGPCGSFTVLTTTITGDLPVASPVPLPAAGGGLPGLLGLGWWFWRRRRQANVQVK
jgi:hypothetical protein